MSGGFLTVAALEMEASYIAGGLAEETCSFVDFFWEIEAEDS